MIQSIKENLKSVEKINRKILNWQFKTKTENVREKSVIIKLVYSRPVAISVLLRPHHPRLG